MNNHCIRIIPPATIARWKGEQRTETACFVVGRLLRWGVVIAAIFSLTLWLDGCAA